VQLGRNYRIEELSTQTVSSVFLVKEIAVVYIVFLVSVLAPVSVHGIKVGSLYQAYIYRKRKGFKKLIITHYAVRFPTVTGESTRRQD